MFKRPWPIWAPHWEARRSMKIFWYTIITLIVAMAIPYTIINQIMGYFDRSVLDPILPIDSMVPFIGWTFIIYLTLYLYYPAAAWFGRVNDHRIREMFAFHQALFIITWVVNLVFIIFPTEVYIRNQIPADIRAGEGFWGFWFGDLMHNTDMPYNAWPSLHVVQSLMIVLLLRRWGVIYRWKEALAWVAWIGLCVSVMTTKQHFFWDLITGIATGLVCWYWMCIPAMEATSNQEWLEAFPSNDSD
jgi:hypothetical protein